MVSQQCRECGCTDVTACLHTDGSPCAWFEDDLCTVCAERPLPDRLADCLADVVDTVLLTVTDTVNECEIELRLGSFNRELSARAAELLEEAGR